MSATFKPKSTLLAAALLACATTSMAQTAAPAAAKEPEPDYTFAYNVGVVTDYRFRGITQTNYGGALQGGVDFSHKSGIYLGVWASNVSWVKQFNGANNGALEVVLYGGFKGELSKGGTIGGARPGDTATEDQLVTAIAAAATESFAQAFK